MATDMMILSTTEPSTKENSPKKLSCFHVYGRETIRAMDEKFQARRLREPGPNQLALLAYIDAVRCLLLDRTLRWPLEVAEDYPLHRLIKRLSENKDHLYDQWLPELSQYASHSIFYDDAAVDDLGLWKDSEPCGMALIAPMSLDLKDKHCEMNFRTFMEAAKLKGRMYPEEIFRTVEWKRGQAVLRSPLYAHVYNQMQGSWPSLLVQPHKQLEEQGLFQPHMKSSYEKMDLVAGYQRGEGAIIDPPSNLNEVGIRDNNLFRSFVAEYNRFTSTVIPASGLDLLLAPVLTPKPTRSVTILTAHKKLVDNLYEVGYESEIFDKARKLWVSVKEKEPDNESLGLEGAILAAKNILKREKDRLQHLGQEC